uniref:Thiosulfate sulfurtransferase/rhodanese-like domain-containing protein n=1 Tax=Xenograpsus testudinatus TaxID=533011 RepID=A0A8A6LP82_9EUCA|nr:thiosulfate sulfurtransferase/rhodanese-like domain-containing protein [Xenograpsus testudinatus]
MAASRPYTRVAQSFASRLCAANPRVCAPSLTAHPCGYCSQQLAHSTTTTTPNCTLHSCSTSTHTPSPSPLASPTHHALPTTSPPRRINRRTELDFDELRTLQLAGDIALIDVRDTQELENYGGIPGSLNIPLSKIKNALQLPEDEWIREYNMEKPELHDRNLVFYARGPNASSAAVEIAHRLGFKRSRHYIGGWEDYCRKTGLPLKKTQDGGFGNYYMDNFDQYFL